MLKRGSVPDVRAGRLTRRDGHLVVTMCYYPRFVRKEQIDEYTNVLAPDRALFGDYKKAERSTGQHDEAFSVVRYEERFRLSKEALGKLDALIEQAGHSDVYLICQCGGEQRCHTDMLLMTAKARGARHVEKPHFDYPMWARRLQAGAFE
jgi:uncharacterized protein YeaO (DUF488 family)